MLFYHESAPRPKSSSLTLAPLASRYWLLADNQQRLARGQTPENSSR